MTGYRRAAVALHGLAAADRQWILAGLPGKDQKVLTQYLSELKSLGFENGGSVAGELFSSLARAFVPAPMAPADRIRHATAQQMFACLEAEPATLIGQLLNILDWPWAPDFLQLFPAVRQERIRATMSEFPIVAPARKEFLIAAIVARLDASTSAVRQSKIAGLFSPLRRRVTAWIR